MSKLERFQAYDVCQSATGVPLELEGNLEEVVCLAFDTKRKRLVEMHILKKGAQQNEDAKLAFFERVKVAQRVDDPRVSSVLDADDQDGMVYYVNAFSDGARVEDYVAKHGSFRLEVALRLVEDLSEALLVVRGVDGDLLRDVDLRNTVVQVDRRGRLGLCVNDLGLGRFFIERRHGKMTGWLDPGRQLGRMLYHLIQGAAFEEGAAMPESFGALPPSLRLLLQETLTTRQDSDSEVEVEAFRDVVREVLEGMGSTRGKGLLAVSRLAVPQSRFLGALLGNVDVTELITERVRFEPLVAGVDTEWSRPVVDLETSSRMTLQVLPSERIVPREHYMPAARSLWSQGPSTSPNLIGVSSVSHTSDATFVFEERCEGLPVSGLLARRGRVGARGVLRILKEIQLALRQAEVAGIAIPSLHPSCLVLAPVDAEVDGDGRGECFLNRSFADWPDFRVKVRTYYSAQSLLENGFEPNWIPGRETPDFSAVLPKLATVLLKPSEVEDSSDLEAYIISCRQVSTAPEVGHFIMGVEHAIERDEDAQRKAAEEARRPALVASEDPFERMSEVPLSDEVMDEVTAEALAVRVAAKREEMSNDVSLEPEPAVSKTPGLVESVPVSSDGEDAVVVKQAGSVRARARVSSGPAASVGEVKPTLGNPKGVAEAVSASPRVQVRRLQEERQPERRITVGFAAAAAGAAAVIGLLFAMGVIRKGDDEVPATAASVNEVIEEEEVEKPVKVGREIIPAAKPAQLER